MTNVKLETSETIALAMISNKVSLVKSDFNSTYSTRSFFKSEKID